MNIQHYCSQCLFLLVLLTSVNIEQVATAAEEDIVKIYGDEDMVSLATGYRQPIDLAPAVATVITEEEINNIGAITLEEVLETVPGLHVSTARGIQPLYTIRGILTELNPHALVMVNDIPIMTSASGGKPEVWSMLVKNIKRIEVIRGPGSAVYGADAFAGVINIITKTAKALNGTEMGAMGGSYDTYGGWLTHGKRWNDIDIAFSIQGKSTNGDRPSIEADDQTRFDALFGTNASLAPGPMSAGRDDIDVRADISYADRWRLRAGYQGFLNVGSGVGSVLALDPGGTLDVQVVNADLSHQNTSFQNMTITSQMSYLGIDTKSHLTLYPSGAFNNAFEYGVLDQLDFHEDQVRVKMDIFHAGVMNHRLRGGTGINYMRFDQPEEKKNFTIDSTGMPVATGVFTDTRSLGENTFLNQEKRTNVYVYAQDEWHFVRDWFLTTGVRIDHYSDFGTTINPRVSLVWNVDYSLTTKLLYGRAFRPPSFLELYATNAAIALGNQNLDPETIDTIELVALKKWNTDLSTNINLFWYQTHDLIEIKSDLATQTPTPATFENVAGTTGYGFEIDVSYDLTADLDLKLNYAFQTSKDKKNHNNQGISPQQQVYAQANWRIAPKWNVGMKMNWIGQRHRQQDDPRKQIDDYVLAGIVIRYQSHLKGWRGTLTMNNLFNEEAREPSFNPSAIPYDLPLPGRSIMAQIGYWIN